MILGLHRDSVEEEPFDLFAHQPRANSLYLVLRRSTVLDILFVFRILAIVMLSRGGGFPEVIICWE